MRGETTVVREPRRGFGPSRQAGRGSSSPSRHQFNPMRRSVPTSVAERSFFPPGCRPLRPYSEMPSGRTPPPVRAAVMTEGRRLSASLLELRAAPGASPALFGRMI